MKRMSVKHSDSTRLSPNNRGSLQETHDVTMIEIIGQLESGVSVNADDASAAAGEPGVLKVSSVCDGRFFPDQNKRILPEERERARVSVRKGDLIISRANTFDLIGACGMAFNDYPNLFLSDKLWRVVLKGSSQDCVAWLNQVLNSTEIRVQLRERCSGTSGSMKNISKDDFLGMTVSRPPFSSQKAIAAVLSAWDRAIERTIALIAAKQRFKQGLTQQLLTGRRRLPEFRKSDRPSIQLGKILAKVSDSVDVVASGTYREIGIRSHGKGIFHKEPVSGASLGDKRVFNVVPGCLVLNIVFAGERALAITSDEEVGMIASHRFPMFQPDLKQVDIQYVLHYMLSDVGSNTLQLASPGGAGRNRTISQEQFLKTEIPLPPVEEQKKIVAIINTAEAELQSLQDKLHSLKKQKRGLMQQLLTGRIRVSDSLIKLGAKS